MLKDPYTMQSGFNPVGPFQLESMLSTVEHDLQKQKYTAPKKSNLNKQEYQAIKDLRHNTDIVTKPADRGSAIVIMGEGNYIKEGQRQLNDTNFYQPTNEDLTGEVIQRVNIYVHTMLQRGQITHKTCSYLTTDINRKKTAICFLKYTRMPTTPLGDQ